MLADDVAHALPLLRAEALARMTSRARVRRKTGQSPTVNGFHVTDWTVVVVNTPFRLGGAIVGNASSTTQEIGTVGIEAAIRVGHFPHTLNTLQDGDFVELLTGENIGRVFEIVDTVWQDQATARRVRLVEVPRPEGWVS